MTDLRFRAPAHPLPLATLLARALPGTPPGRLAAWIAGGAVRVAGRAVRAPDAEVPAGARVEARGSAVPDAGAPRAAFPDAGEAGAGAAPGAGRWRALVAPPPPWPSGALAPEAAPTPAAAPSGGAAERGAAGGPVRFRVEETREGVARLALEAPALPAERLAALLAAAGFPLLADVRHGGVLVEGGLRLAPGDAPSEDARLAWPGEPVFPPAWAPRDPRAELAVSAATLHALGRGHPWILPDTETGDTDSFQPGTLVRLRAARTRDVRGARPAAGDEPLLACIEGGRIAARLWGRGAPRGDTTSVEARVAKALARRRALLEGRAVTDAFRLVHGEADGLPGLAVDLLGPLLRVLVTGRACEAFRPRAVDALVQRLAGALGADPPVVEVVHLRDAPAGALEAVRLARGALPPGACDAAGRFAVREHGLVYRVDPGLGAPGEPGPGIGLFLDQRDNRARLAAHARGGRWLNLFAHTGAFSVALLAAGAAHVTSVDLSRPYLHWLEANLAANALPADRHTSVCEDGRRHLERRGGEAPFHGIVIDPPTAAAAGRRFWSVRRDLPPLVAAALGQLAPGGILFVARNDRGARGGLAALVQEAAGRAGRGLHRVDPAPPGLDFPRLPGFPEGDPFDAVIARTQR